MSSGPEEGTDSAKEEESGVTSPASKGAAATQEQQQLPAGASVDPEARPEDAPLTNDGSPSKASPSFLPQQRSASPTSFRSQPQQQESSASVKPFFFAQVNFTKRFLRSDDEIAASATPAGESRPAGGVDA